MAENGAERAADERTGPPEGDDTRDVVATAECGGCAKPLVRRQVRRWQHADGKTYWHPITPYFVRTVEDPGNAELADLRARVARVLAYIGDGTGPTGYGNDPLLIQAMLTEDPEQRQDGEP